ncbi:MAG TPA: MFS transporter [Stellaceae bacterium]
MATSNPADAQIVARIERLPLSSWHGKIGLVIGTGFFFDAFDAMAIAYTLPILVGLWHLAPSQIGFVISIGFAGQLVGSLFFGWLAEKIGRVPCAIIALAIFSVMSLACAFTWDLTSMAVARFVQGLGLGAEIPVLATYVNELASAKRRGRFAISYQAMFALGLPITAFLGAWIVPSFGWQWMFIIGAAPALIVLPFMWRLPESPRWLANHGRAEEADRVLSRIEAIISKNGAKPLPPVPAAAPVAARGETHIGGLFRGIYLKRTLTVWAMWFCTYIVTFGVLTWAPTLWRTVYHLSVQDALTYTSILALIVAPGLVVTVLLIDVIGRRKLFMIGLFCGALPMLFLAIRPDLPAFTTMLLMASSQFFIGMLALALSTYTAELYPTELRALGGGFGNAWLRIGSIAGPAFIGAVLPLAGLQAVFLAFGLFALAGGIVTALFAIESNGKLLEQLSPSLPPRGTPLSAAQPAAGDD